MGRAQQDNESFFAVIFQGTSSLEGPFHREEFVEAKSNIEGDKFCPS